MNTVAIQDRDGTIDVEDPGYASCGSRKPRSGTPPRAAHEAVIDLADAWMTGDIYRDLGSRATGGCRSGARLAPAPAPRSGRAARDPSRPLT
jgi:histidinol phosphatase-like enzyme